MKATLNHYSGLAAEGTVARDYAARGFELLAQRWRGKGGEIDLVFSKDAQVVFVEVKKGQCLDTALARITRQQVARIMAAAGEFLSGMPSGLLTEARFDVALVGRDGRYRVIENALWQ